MIAPQTLLQNRYLVLDQIGQGGMGAVYLATDQRFGSTVALKETFFTASTLRRAFEREARLLNRLRHPALPNVSDHFVEDEGQFLVMEFIPGEDLSEMLKKQGGAFPVNEVLGWADQLLDALDYLHTQESPVIHRDIKPQNLKLTPRGQIILLDFGLAKGTPVQVSQVTASGSLYGFSRNYAPIEQIQGTGTDPRSDLYSLAATVYHLMTGVTPPDALTRAADVLNGQPDPLRPANEVHNQVSPAVAQVLARALSHNAGQRPQTAAAMRQEIRDATKLTHVSGESTNAEVLASSTILDQDTLLLGTQGAGAGTPTEAVVSDRASRTKVQDKTKIGVVASTDLSKPAASTNTGKSDSEVTQLKKVGVSNRPISGRTVGIGGGLLLLIIAAVVFAMTRQTTAPLSNPAPPIESTNPVANPPQVEQTNANQNANIRSTLPDNAQASTPPTSESTSKPKGTGTQAASKELPTSPATTESPKSRTKTNTNAAGNSKNANSSDLTADQIAEERRRARIMQKRAAAERLRAQRERRRIEELRRRQFYPRP